MNKDREQSEEFVTEQGLRQRWALSPILFIMIIDDVAKEIKSKIKQTHVDYKSLKTVSSEEMVWWCLKNRNEPKYNLTYGKKF